MTTTNQPTKIYFAIDSVNTKRGVKGLAIYEITKDTLIPRYLGQQLYRPGMTRGRETEVCQFLLDRDKETLKDWTEYSYFTDYSLATKLDFDIVINAYIIDVK